MTRVNSRMKHISQKEKIKTCQVPFARRSKR